MVDGEIIGAESTSGRPPGRREIGYEGITTVNVQATIEDCRTFDNVTIDGFFLYHRCPAPDKRQE